MHKVQAEVMPAPAASQGKGLKILTGNIIW